jgi:hypothetical protein
MLRGGQLQRAQLVVSVRLLRLFRACPSTRPGLTVSFGNAQGVQGMYNT